MTMHTQQHVTYVHAHPDSMTHVPTGPCIPSSVPYVPCMTMHTLLVWHVSSYNHAHPNSVAHVLV